METRCLPDAVLGKVQALGPAGEQWLRDLPERLRALERAWDVTLGATLSGGSAACVAEATAADGAAAVLKLHLPGYDDIANEVRVLRLANGRGYVRLLREDAALGAVLLERLGPPLAELGLPTDRQLAITLATLQRAWVSDPEAATFPTGAEKARWLHDFIASLWEELGRPCPERVIALALAYCRTREAAFDPARCVLVHGDVHSANVLAPLAWDGTTHEGFKLIDPDGYFAERAYDLGVLLRDWSAELLAGDPPALGRERCAYLAQQTGEEPSAIWQWACIERVSTGLLLLQTGFPDEGRDFLHIATAWLGTT